MPSNDTTMDMPTLADGLIMEIGHVPAEKRYTTMSDEKIKQVAMDCVEDRIFGSWMLRKGDEYNVTMVFMVIMMMPLWWRLELERDEIVQFYEYLSEASPRGVNGYPCFFSLRTLDRNDVRRIDIAIKRIVALKKKFMDEDSEDTNNTGENNADA